MSVQESEQENETVYFLSKFFLRTEIAFGIDASKLFLPCYTDYAAIQWTFDFVAKKEHLIRPTIDETSDLPKVDLTKVVPDN
jgi:hypothetical protein